MKLSERNIKWILVFYGLMAAGIVWFAAGRYSTEVSQMPLRVTAMQEALDSIGEG